MIWSLYLRRRRDGEVGGWCDGVAVMAWWCVEGKGEGGKGEVRG